MSKPARKTRTTKQTLTPPTVSTVAVASMPAIAAPLLPPPAQAGVIFPLDVLAELRAGAELLAELVAKATAAAQQQVVKRELDVIAHEAADSNWAGQLINETPTPAERMAPLRARAARGSVAPPSGPSVQAAQQHGGRKADLSDPRLLGVTELERVFAGWKIHVKVQAEGFEWGGKVWPSLSAIARAVTGTRRNGFEFFNLTERSKHS